MSIQKILAASLAALAVAGVILGTSGCSDDNLQGEITEAGSTTVLPLAEDFAREFMKEYPKITIKVEGGGSGEGISRVSEGDIDIGAASRELKPDEPDLVKHLIGRDGIAIVVHPNNPLGNLTLEDLRDIYAGKITDWSEISGSSGPISIVCRMEGSGTRDTFEELVMGEEPITDTVILEPSNSDVRSYVSVHPEALGFISVGYIDHTVKALSINNVACNKANCVSGEYRLVRPLYFLTQSEIDPLVQSFLDYCLSDAAQSIITDEGFISVR